MMTKLKGFLYGRYVKQLFIISLISFFGLLGSSFVNSEWIFQEVGTPFTVAGQINYTLNARPSGAGIVEGANVIVPAFYVPKRWSSYQYYSLFYYNTSGYMVKNSYQNKASYNSEVYQVVFDSFYLTTPESLSGCTTAFPCGGVSTSYDTYRNNTNYKGKMTRFAYYYSSNSNYESSICLIFDSFDSAFCFYNNQNYVGVNGLTTNPAEFDISLVGNSPWVSNTSSIGSGTFDSVNLNNYNTLYQSYLRKGYKDVLCYGGFGLDDLYFTGDSFSGLNVGGGASAFDLFQVYSGGLSFVDWYNKNDNDFVYFNAFRDGYEAVNFLGKSKGLVGLGLVKQIYWKSENPLLARDLQIFCNIVVNHSEEINHNTWDGQYFDDYINQDKLNQLIGDIGVVVPISGTALDLLRNQYMSGSSSFSGCSSPEECISNGGIDKSIDMAWKTWSIEGLRGNITGLLPWYVVFGFLGIMFLYILRR